MIYAGLNTSIKNMAQLPIDNYWSLFTTLNPSGRKHTSLLIYRLVIITALCQLLLPACAFLDSCPCQFSFTSAESPETGNTVPDTAHLIVPASESLASTSKSWSTRGIAYHTVPKHGLCLCSMTF